MKSYYDYVDEITADDLYKGLLGFGMFSERIPPVFSSEKFYEYCKNNAPSFQDKPRQYAYYENVRNINIPRPLGIPTPMTYQRLTKHLVDNWEKVQNHFKDYTENQTHKVSRIHIRKINGENEIFKMNYDSWRNDGSPENKLVYGMRYVAHADISKCFPSIYTHSIPWALVGKENAKKNKKKDKEWYNKLDHYVQINKDSETHGLLIGPHVSNLLSEIILCVVDYELVEKGWKYIRNIDDYMCYVESEEDAEKFFVDLQEELRKFDLSLNHKKTKIEKLPSSMSAHWKRKINTMALVCSYGKVDYNNCRSYLDYAIEIAEKEEGDARVLNYAIKTLSGEELTPNAKEYEKDIVFHLSILLPYLVPLLKPFVFEKCDVPVDDIKKLSMTLYDNGVKNKSYEQVSYAIYFAIIYDFDLPINVNVLINTNDCVLLTMGYLYHKKRNNKNEIASLKKYAQSLISIPEDFERLWLFAYEILSKSDLKGDWKNLKNNNISFIKDELFI